MTSTITFPKRVKRSPQTKNNSAKRQSEPLPGLQTILDTGLPMLNVTMQRTFLEAYKPLAKKTMEIANKLNELVNEIRTAEIEFRERLLDVAYIEIDDDTIECNSS